MIFLKPYRMRLANELISSYQLLPKLDAFKPTKLSRQELVKFHCDDFIDFLSEVTPQHQQALNAYVASKDNQGVNLNGLLDEQKVAEMQEWERKFKLYSVDGDCPVFAGLYKFCEIYSGGSVGGALKLNRGAADIAINWSGGLHHAKKAEVSGFCYVNDIVLAIIELLRYHERVLYIDIDVHHGQPTGELIDERIQSYFFYHLLMHFYLLMICV